jgi:hypothetical protein
MIDRRHALAWIAWGAAALSALRRPWRLWAAGRAPASFAPHERAALDALAEVVLPGELGPAGQREVVDGFALWLREYREGAEREHGYGGAPLPRSDVASQGASGPTRAASSAPAGPAEADGQRTPAAGGPPPAGGSPASGSRTTLPAGKPAAPGKRPAAPGPPLEARGELHSTSAGGAAASADRRAPAGGTAAAARQGNPAAGRQATATRPTRAAGGAVTPPSPMRRYPAQLAALDREAGGRGRFAALPAEARRPIVERAIAAARVDRLPPRPDGGHVATDLMAYFFWSSRANDLCYRADIARDDCRGLPGSEQPPRAWAR